MTAFKEKTAGQMIGIAKINHRLEKIILEQGITGKKDLDSLDGEFYLDISHGGFVCSNCSHSGLKFSPEAVKTLRDLSQNKLSRVNDQVLKELGVVTTALIDEHFSIRLKSRELL